MRLYAIIYLFATLLTIIHCQKTFSTDWSKRMHKRAMSFSTGWAKRDGGEPIEVDELDASRPQHAKSAPRALNSSPTKLMNARTNNWLKRSADIPRDFYNTGEFEAAE